MAELSIWGWQEPFCFSHTGPRPEDWGKAVIKLGHGGRGSGKTRAVVTAVIHYASQWPGALILFACPTFPKLKQDVLPVVWAVFDELGLKKNRDWTYHVDDHELHVFGCTIIFRTTDDPSVFRGPTAAAFAMDECALSPLEAFANLIGTLRQAGYPHHGWLASTPAGKMHWMCRIFRPEIAVYAPGEQKLRPDLGSTKWLSWAARTRDNPFEGEQLYQEMISIYGENSPMARQELLGEFVSMEGLVYDTWNPDTMVVPVSRWPEIPSHVLAGVDFGWCVDTETEILTKRGWLHWDEVGILDETLGYDIATDSARWVPISNVSKFRGRFDMVGYEGKTHSSFTTANHRWPRTYPSKRAPSQKRRVFVESQELRAHHAIPRARPVSNLPAHAKYPDALAELAGWLFTEGSIEKSGFISIWQNEGAKAQKIRDCLSALWGSPLTKTRNGRRRAEAGWVERVHRLNTQGVAALHFSLNLNASDSLAVVHHNKVIRPEFIAELTSKQLELFIEAALDGDGFTSNTGTRGISQVKREQLDALQMACQLLGLPTNIFPITNIHRYGAAQGWQLSIRRGLNVYPAHNPSNHLAALETTVWCPTTSTGTWLARRHGKVYFTGNTNPACILVYGIDSHKRRYVMDEYYQAHTDEEKLVKVAKDLRELYKIRAFSCDSASPDKIAAFRRAGLPAFKAYKKRGHAGDQSTGIGMCYRALSRQVPHTDEDGVEHLTQGFYVSPTAINFRREIENNTYPNLVAGRNPKESVGPIDNHSLDAWRYTEALITRLYDPITEHRPPMNLKISLGSN